MVEPSRVCAPPQRPIRKCGEQYSRTWDLSNCYGANPKMCDPGRSVCRIQGGGFQPEQSCESQQPEPASKWPDFRENHECGGFEGQRPRGSAHHAARAEVCVLTLPLGERPKRSSD